MKQNEIRINVEEKGVAVGICVLLGLGILIGKIIG